MDIASVIDHTNLAPDASAEDIRKLCGVDANACISHRKNNTFLMIKR